MAENELNRREFVIAAGAMVAGCGGCASNPGANAPHESVALSPAKIVDVGTPADYLTPGVYDRFVKVNRVLLVREGNHLSALEGTCSHKNCALKSLGTEVLCPCHGSRFDTSGKVLRGPADVPLDHYSIALVAGRIVVDKSKNPDADDEGRWVTLTA